MTKSLDEYAKEWQGNAEADALWVILTDSRYYGRKWDVAEFFSTGEEEIARVFNYMKQKSITVPSGSFLDFGCGVGRVSRALQKRFEQGYGVDISPKMIELAHAYVPDIEFMVNRSDSIEQFFNDSLDFVYSHIVLQHIPNHYQKRYIDEFLRILRPGGLAVLQVLVEIIHHRKINPGFLYRIKQEVKLYLPFLVGIKRWLIPPKSFHYEFKCEMHPLPDDDIRLICERKRCVIESAPATNSCEPDHNGQIEFYDLREHKRSLEESGLPNRYLSCMYFVRKPFTTSSL